MISKRLNLEKINTKIEDNLVDYITTCENRYKNQIFEAVHNILEKGNVKFVLLAGPSSSGKTTTSKILVKTFNDMGLNAKCLSLDDYFVEREETPRWDDGEYNYETFDAIDWKLFGKCMSGLLNGEPVKLPTYNFAAGSKEFFGETVMTSNSIVILEGLHALNPIINQFIPEKNSFKIYISATTDIFYNEQPYLEHETIRLYRRIIRDLYTRATSIDETMKMWKKVGIGENLYINPYIHTVDFEINSFHGYELCVYNNFFNMIKDDKSENVKEIIKTLSPLKSLDPRIVPSDSVLQEFMPKLDK